MTQSALSSLTLGYRPLWGRTRRLAGIQLYVHEDSGSSADMAHFLRTVDEIWSRQAPPLLISPQSRQVLCNLLEHAPQGSPWIEVRGDWLQQDEGIYEPGAEGQGARADAGLGRIAGRCARCRCGALLCQQPAEPAAARSRRTAQCGASKPAGKGCRQEAASGFLPPSP